MLTAWSGAVLTGGSSRRMGRDKASLEIDGRPMAARVADALLEAGGAEVFCVGGVSGDPALRVVPDDRAGEGPLNGLITALQAANRDLVVVLACDLLEPSAAAIRRVVEAATGTPAAEAPVTVPLVAGRPQWLHGAWRRDACLGPLLAAFDGGERSIHRATAALEVRFVDDPGPGFDDADTPEDLTDGG